MNNLDDDSFVEELVLDATHTGETYRKAELAIDRAFADFQKRRREEEAESFALLRGKAIAELKAYWARMDREERGQFPPGVGGVV